MFVSESGGNLDRLFVAGGMTVTAGSSTTGSVRAWGDDGRPAPVQSGSLASAALASSRTTREIARLREWIQVSTWRLQAEKTLLEDLLQKESDIECVTGTGWKPHPTRFDQLTFVVITRDGADHAVFEVNWDPDRAGHRLFRKRFGPPAELLRAWRGNLRTRTGEALMPLPGPAGKMTACLLGPGGLYVAFAAGGIRRYWASQGEEPLREDGPFWTASRPVTLDADGGPKTFTDLDFGAALLESWCPALYAVTGGPEIYRFGDEGEPDQRIEFQ